MESVSYYRGIQRYLKSKISKLETADYEAILGMELINPKPGVLFSTKPYVLEDFKDWFHKGGEEKIKESHLMNEDFGFESYRNNYAHRAKEILGLSHKASTRLFSLEDKEIFKESMIQSLVEDTYRTMFFFLFSFFVHNVEKQSVYISLWNMKPNEGDYPLAFTLFFKSVESSKFDFDKTGLGNILQYLKDNYNDAFYVWSKMVPDEIYLSSIRNPYFYSEFCNNSVKIFNLGPLGLDLKKGKTKNMFFNATIGLLSRNRLIVSSSVSNEIELRLEVEEGKTLFALYVNKKIVTRKENIQDFFSYEYKHNRLDYILKNAEEIKILA